MNNSHRLFYNKPASHWEEALPIGNGKLGAMVYGGVPKEELQLNEDTLWSGPPQYEPNPDNPKLVKMARELISNKKYSEAHKFINENILLKADECQSYCTAGSLLLDFQDLSLDDIKDYTRELFLDRALQKTSYKKGDNLITREVLASHNDKVIALRISSQNEEELKFIAGFDSPVPFKIEKSDQISNSLIIKGNMPACNPGLINNGEITADNIWDNSIREKNPIEFCVYINCLAPEGEIKEKDGKLHIKGNKEVFIFLSIVSNFDGFNKEPGSAGRDILKEAKGLTDKAVSKGWQDILTDHEEEHRKLYDRVSLEIGKAEEDDLPTDQRLKMLNSPEDDSTIIALLFNYGRYLLISSSRPGSEPVNLQGIWNKAIHPPWSGRYTININTEMNYWPARSCALPECEEPLFRMLKGMAEKGTKTANVLYNAEGWCSHHNTDIWRWTSYVQHDTRWAFWPLSGGWLCRNIMEAFRYSGNISHLEEYFDVLRSQAAFLLDYLTEDSEGKLCTFPATSPENTFKDPETGQTAGAALHSAINLSIVREVFKDTLEAASILGKNDDPILERISASLEKLAEHKIGSNGQLLEYDQEFEEEDIHHRHVSHLYGAYPGNEFNDEITPELMTACRKSLDIRGDESTGWAMAWRINLWARFLDGERALKVLGLFLKLIEMDKDIQYHSGGIYPNLFCAHPPFQIDGNLGVSAGIAEMLLQSHKNYLHFLPAIPKAWKTGSVKGLRARGGFVCDFSWQEGKLTECKVTSLLGTKITAICGDKKAEIIESVGKDFELNELLG